MSLQREAIEAVLAEFKVPRKWNHWLFKALVDTNEGNDVVEYRDSSTPIEFFGSPWRTFIVHNGTVTLDDEADEFQSVTIRGATYFAAVGWSDGIHQLVIFPDCTAEQLREALTQVNAQLGQEVH